MERRLYCIYDIKAEAVVGGVVQLLGTDAEAARMFTGVLTTPGTICHEHPEDFNLMLLGTIDYESMKITPNLSSLQIPVTTGVAIVRELERARSAIPSSQGDSISDVVRNQLELAPA